MPRCRAAVAALLALVTEPAAAAPNADPRHLLGDLCATPPRWAPPVTAVYHLRNGGTVVFVAVVHTSDPQSPTFRLLAAAFDRYRPTSAFVEGAALRKSDQASYLAYLADQARTRAAQSRIGENLHAVRLAADRGIRYAGWDISPHDEYVSDIAAGFMIEDAIGAHLLRAGLNPFASPAPAAMQAELDAVPQLRRPEHFDFAGWYRRTYGDTFDPSAGTPCGAGIASEIVKDESVRRTLGIVTLLDRYAVPGAVVLVEAGANHWLALHDYLASISRRGG